MKRGWWPRGGAQWCGKGTGLCSGCARRVCHAVLSPTVPYCAIPLCAVPHCAPLCHTVPYRFVLCPTVPCCPHRVDQPCPRGWWGHPTCGPCSCDVTKGFDPDCNKTTGECRCKVSAPHHPTLRPHPAQPRRPTVPPQENHYRPAGSDTCLLCDCYPTGSLSRLCDATSGQCPCKPGVIGRHCDRCDNPFAEVTVSGCEGG